MKGIQIAAAATAFAVGAVADHQQHAHMHRHRAVNVDQPHVAARREVFQVKRDDNEINADIETIYVYADGETVNDAEAEACIADGECIVIGTSTPTPAPVTSTQHDAEFFQSTSSSSSSSSSSTSTTPTPTPTPSTSSTSTTPTFTSTTSWSTTSWSTSTSSSSSTTLSTFTKTSSSSAAPATSSASSSSVSVSSGSGSSSSFPSGKVPCSTFPSAYGAVALDWLDLDGWASVQTTGDWTPGALIAAIDQAINGGCVKNSFCSYACAPGQSKAQWPTTSQGATGQSIGGLWCNSDGYLELTNPDFDTLCQEGLGGITIKNELEKVAAVCGTNYPGDEKMSIPLVTKPGGEYTLTNINAKTAYQWQGKYTSGQFYVNNQGVDVDQACVWDSTSFPTSAGNWAPVNIGAGTDINGVTYISIFPNTPTTSAKLDFDIVISGGITSPCYLKSGSYYGGSQGCTTSLKTGGQAVITFKPYGSG